MEDQQNILRHNNLEETVTEHFLLIMKHCSLDATPQGLQKQAWYENIMLGESIPPHSTSNKTDTHTHTQLLKHIKTTVHVFFSLFLVTQQHPGKWN